MDLAANCKDKLQHFRIKELKDVLTELGLSKQGKKQDLVDRILAVLVDDQVAKILAKRPRFSKEDVAKLVDDTYRKIQGCGATDLASKIQVVTSDTSHAEMKATRPTTLKPKEEVNDSFNIDMKVRCPCGSSLLTGSMIQCDDSRCQVWQHISCVIIPEKPLDGIPAVPPQFYCELCRLGRADPFLSTVSHPLLPVKLTTTSMPTDGSSNPVQAADKSFHLTRSDRESLSKPEYFVQAWCMLFNDKVPFRMQWPQYADLQFNGMAVRAVSRPGSQLLGANGRDDGPNISQFTRDGINKISLTGCDARIFCFGVRLVKRRTLQQILSTIPKESDGERFEDALARVVRCFGGGGAAENDDSDSDLEVVADSVTINLRCPMSGSRMKIAGRFKPCVHMGCFDLETFVEMQQRSRKWQCPICLKNYALEHIIIDPYFNHIATMMQSCGEDTTEIETKPDGSWRVKGECDRRDLTQWRLPDRRLCLPNEEESKHKAEASKPVKQESGKLKIGMRKNSNGVWEVNNKHVDNKVSGNFINGGLNVRPISSSATGSGRDAEDRSVNQDGTSNFDWAANSGLDIDSVSLNLDPSHQLTTQNAPASAKDADVIVLSDSDEENDMITPGAGTVHSNVFEYNYNVGSHGASGSYQVEPGLEVGGSACLNLFDQADDDYVLPALHMPSNTQAGSGFQLFDSNVDGLDMLGHDNALNSGGFVQDASFRYSSDDLNDSLVDNPLAFGVEDLSFQHFLPTMPSGLSGPSEARNQQDVSNGFANDDWISLRLGDGVGVSHEDLGNTKYMNSGLQPHHTEGTVDSLGKTASIFSSSSGNKSEKSRESSFSIPRQKRSVRPRLDLMIDSESD